MIKQKYILKLRWTERKLEKAKKTKDYIKKLLTKSKSLLGHCISIEDLMNAVLTECDRVEFIVKTELSYSNLNWTGLFHF